MYSKKDQDTQAKLKKRGSILRFFMFPLVVIQNYNHYFRRVRKIVDILEAHDKKHGVEKAKGKGLFNGNQGTVQSLKSMSGRLGTQQVLLIVLPLVIACGFSAASVYENREGYSRFYSHIKTTGKFIISPKGRKYIKTNKTKGIYKILTSIVKTHPFKARHFIWMMPAYLLSVFGAAYLNEFEAFRKNRILKQIFVKRKFVDMDDNPWDACWTPYAILVYAYQADPEDVGARSDIWGAVNFGGGVVIQDLSNIQTFVVTESTNVPHSIEIKIPDDIFQKDEKKS